MVLWVEEERGERTIKRWIQKIKVITKTGSFPPDIVLQYKSTRWHTYQHKILSMLLTLQIPKTG